MWIRHDDRMWDAMVYERETKYDNNNNINAIFILPNHFQSTASFRILKNVSLHYRSLMRHRLEDIFMSVCLDRAYVYQVLPVP